MKYFYDTEFIEDGHSIDLISIGIVAEDGREYYAISTEFDYKKAEQNEWLKENVLSKLPPEYTSPDWKTRSQIKQDILDFIGEDKPEFWAYYADYDHVALCQIFGKMIDLPKGWPMYTNDLKQLLNSLGNPRIAKQKDGEHNALSDAKWLRDTYFSLVN